jgi:membrane protein YdbS with pleckstrin-like domain
MARQAAWVKLGIWAVLSGLVAYGIWWLTPQGATATMIMAAIWLVPALVGGVLWFRLPVLRYRHSSWRLDGESLEIRRGAWWFSETRVPRSRIQHTDVSQGPIERRHGLGHLVVYTAGTHHSEIKLGGIAHETAIAIRDQLLQSGRHAPV